MAHAEDIELAWFAGIFEGEGSLVMCLTNRKEGGLHLACQASLTNTDANLIDEVSQISRKYQIEPVIRWRENKNHPTWKIKGEVWWYGQTKLLSLCRLLLPYIRGEKKSKSEKIIQYLEVRKNRKTYHENHDMGMLQSIINPKISSTQSLRLDEAILRKGRLYAR